VRTARSMRTALPARAVRPTLTRAEGPCWHRELRRCIQGVGMRGAPVPSARPFSPRTADTSTPFAGQTVCNPTENPTRPKHLYEPYTLQAPRLKTSQDQNQDPTTGCRERAGQIRNPFLAPASWPRITVGSAGPEPRGHRKVVKGEGWVDADQETTSRVQEADGGETGSKRAGRAPAEDVDVAHRHAA